MTGPAILETLGRIGTWLREGRDALRGTGRWSAGARWDMAYGAGFRDGARAGCDALRAWQVHE